MPRKNNSTAHVTLKKKTAHGHVSEQLCVVQVIHTLSGFLTRWNALEGQALKELQLERTPRKTVGREIFIIPKESAGDLKQLRLLLTSPRSAEGERWGREGRRRVLRASLRGNLGLCLILQPRGSGTHTGRHRKKTSPYWVTQRSRTRAH